MSSAVSFYTRLKMNPTLFNALTSSLFSKFLFWIGLCGISVTTSYAQSINLKNAHILISPQITSPMQETVVEVLQEEIQNRSGILLKKQGAWQKNNTPTIALALASDSQLFGQNLPKSEQKINNEGFRIFTETNGKSPIIWIIGADSRGILFGAGWLLRHLEFSQGNINLNQPVDLTTAPVQSMRGHQLGYRNTANTYDAWTVKQFDQYIRELAIFGSNAVEGIPFEEQEKTSPHYKISPPEMRTKMSEICQKYDMDYWVWTPVIFDLKETDKRQKELKNFEALFTASPRLDHVFVPGGDPGHNHPSLVLPFLKDLQALLVKYHPKAKVWVSLQGFNVEETDYFYNYLEMHKPHWLEGVVTGPGSPPAAETRYRLAKNYKHRQYPDITHNVRCEFPVTQFDQAFAVTLGREAINPRPYAFAQIHQNFVPFTDGFVSYSDGSHDDLNKVIWSIRGWNPDYDVHQILKEYAQFFFNTTHADQVANGIESLERNWNGPIAENGGIEATFSYWKELEKNVPALRKSWRGQMFLLRAYYDAYTRKRYIYEQRLEKDANQILAQVDAKSIDSKMKAALAKMQEADTKPIAPALRKDVDDLAEALFVSIGLQTKTVEHGAKGPERGCVMDFIDYPLNNRWWLSDEFEKINAFKDDSTKLSRLNTISRWETPGIGSYYDDVSSISKGKRVKTISYDATDVAWWDNGKSRRRLSSQLFQREPELDYDQLDPLARYRIRIVGFGDALLRVDGKRLDPIIYNKEIDSIKEWIVPHELTRDGRISVMFDGPEESSLNWRMNSKISDIWLIKD